MSAHHHTTSIPVPDRSVVLAGRSPYSAEAGTIIAKAVRMRQHLLRTGRGHMPTTIAQAACDRLTMWLRTNPCPSGTTLRSFWQGQHGNDLRTVVVHTPAGQRMLDRFAFLASTII